MVKSGRRDTHFSDIRVSMCCNYSFSVLKLMRIHFEHSPSSCFINAAARLDSLQDSLLVQKMKIKNEQSVYPSFISKARPKLSLRLFSLQTWLSVGQSRKTIDTSNPRSVERKTSMLTLTWNETCHTTASISAVNHYIDTYDWNEVKATDINSVQKTVTARSET